MKVCTNLLWAKYFLAFMPFAVQAAIGVNGDAYSIPSDGLLLVEADGVLSNDTMNDSQGSAQFVLDVAQNHILTLITPPTQGTLKCNTAINTICQDGSFQFTVNPTSFSGMDSFTYRLEVDNGLPSYESADTTVVLKACSTNGGVSICWSEGAFFEALNAVSDPNNPFYVKHEGFEGTSWTTYRSYQNPPPDSSWVYNGATTITSKGIDWTTNHTATNILSTSTGATFTGAYGVFDPAHGFATNTSVGECQILQANNNDVVPPECLPYDGFSGNSTAPLYAVGGYIKGSNAAANIEIITDGGAPNNIGKLVTPAHQFYGVIDTTGFSSFQFRDIDGKTGQPLFIFGDDFYLVTRDVADANQAPVIGAVVNQTAVAGGVFDITIPVSDPDGDNVTSDFAGIPADNNPRLFENDGSVRLRWFPPTTAAGTYTVSITVTDNGYPKLSQVLNFQLTVTPPPPTLILPGNITREATSSAGAVVSYTASANDVTDGALPSGCAPASGSTFALGSTTVNCSVTNSSNLTTTGSFTVSVRDTTAPSVTAPPAIIREATGASTAVTLDMSSAATASDLVSGTLTPLPNNTGPFSVGIHNITWSASDSAGNIGSAIQTVTITDTTSPAISVPTNMTVEATGPAGTAVSYTVTGNDTVDGSIAGVCTPVSGANFGLALTTVNCSVTDTAGNSASGSFTVDVVDSTAPVVTAPLNITLEATGTTTAVTLGNASASDGVSPALIPTANNTGPFAVGVHAIIWSATDAAGNTGTDTQTVTITDNTGPALNLPASFNAEATSSTGATVTYSASASDLVDGVRTVSCTPASGNNFGFVSTLVSCSASDTKGNTSTGSFTITVADTTAPVVIAPLDITVEATGPTTDVMLGSASASDTVSGTLTPSASNTGPFAVGVHTIIWSATDTASNTGTATQIITITDTGAPTLSLPADISAEASSSAGATVTYLATANDTVDGAIIPACTPASGSIFALGTTIVNCSVTDNSNHTSSNSFNINVVDTTAPVVTAPLDITMEATGSTTAVNLGSASSSDLVDGSIVPTASISGPFAVGVHTIIWSATDTANNTGTATQIITITDTGAPELILPGHLSVEASSSLGAVVNYSATASDIVDGSLIPVCSPASGSTFAQGTSAVNCSVTDSANLTTSAGFNVTVVDTSAPVVTAPVDITIEATGVSTPVSLGIASANDLVSGVLTPTASSSGPFTVGIHTIIWSATDAANNTGTATQTVTITDTSAPVLNLPADISQGVTSSSGAIVNYTVTANDVADGSVVPSCSPLSGSNFTLGTTAVNCSAVDSANNSASGSFNITITDTGAPVLSLPTNISSEATSAAGAIVTYIATASDAIDGPVTANCLPASGSTFAPGNNVVNCSAQDLEGNISNGSFIVSIVDTAPPDVTAPINITVEATGTTTTVTLGNASASDLVSGSLNPVASNSGPFTVGVHSIIWSATDAANNTGTAAQTITVTDTTAPVLSMQQGVSQEATSAAGAVVNYSVSANDIVDGALVSSCLPLSATTFALGTTAVNCTVTDSANLTTTGSFNVTIVDTTAPVVTAPANISTEATGATTVVALGIASANDLVSGVLTATADNTGPFAVGMHTITWSATDAANNTGTATQIVNITDIGSPTLSLPANITAEASSASGALVNYTVSASDVVDGVITATCAPASGSNFALGSTTVNCSATDSSNQTTTGSFSVTVADTTGPVLTLPADISINTTSSTGAIATYITSATDVVDGAILPDCSPVSGSSFAVGTTIVNCSASDSANNTSTGSFNVTVINNTVNNQPVAAAGSQQSVSVGSSVMLNGSASNDPDGDALSYQWTLVALPQGSQAVINNDTLVSASFDPDQPGEYIAQLIVTDIHNLRSLASRVTINAVNNVPVADAGTDQTVVTGSQVTLNGILSSDANGDSLTYQWSLSTPTGSAALLALATSASPSFIADVAGTYSAQLIVNDGLVNSTADSVLITAELPVDVAPTISVPANIRVASTGYLTPVNLGVASATDAEDGTLQPAADNPGPFTPGYHEVTWSVTDSSNNTVSAIQVVEVLPMVNFQLDQQVEAGQATIGISLNMNGFAPQYPVELNYDVTVNGSTSSSTVSIASGITGVINYPIPSTANAGSTITFSLNSATNAVVGANSTHSISLINTNVAPIVDIEVTQNGIVTKNLHTNAGAVTITARVHDANQGDSHTFDWSTTDNNLTNSGSVDTFSFNPIGLINGNYKIGVKVVDSGLLEAENEIYVRVITQDFAPPAGADSDNDGLEDALEGDQDDDNDGVPNYLDAIDEQSELLQMQAGESGKWVLATQAGLSLRLGKIAQLSEKYAANISASELAQFASLGRVVATSDPDDSNYTSTDGYLDFTINGLTTTGQSVELVIPLFSPIPDRAVYRKYSADTGWSTFVEDTANALSSAPGANGVCPAPGSSDYQTGLSAGDYCVQMLIQDGGPNDNDLLSNGVITDPGGIAVAVNPTTNPPTTNPPATSGSSGGGGGAIDFHLLLCMILMLVIPTGFRFCTPRE